MSPRSQRPQYTVPSYSLLRPPGVVQPVQAIHAVGTAPALAGLTARRPRRQASLFPKLNHGSGFGLRALCSYLPCQTRGLGCSNPRRV
ncbi:hypothetical protein BO70DRAFT_108268 [Aspergillus heteromorphus CBS 117.55]|uniref:Uncharacterized protein n=1 Tax=Aspergillus heteromorphus CBS 117.55 TaxID=1448321 RepID=A0A317VJZ8_9EURO|nr:uncharacterized protein BO70DRAFT_108268 [Aspergillus heteromorphus CBS 117.55]PWY73581.1 hypothetical protein BO70DRAFT_108268 [Aspergillus heteromorphus CBS 117.55]